MNRYVLTAKSLITDSWLVRITMLVFGLVSLVMAIMGEAIPVVIFFAILLMGVGYTARIYLQSERRRLVPGMNEASATVSIAFLIVCWIVCSALIVGLHGFTPEAIGGCFCGLAFSLWFGCFETAAGPFLFLPYFVPLVAFSYQDTSKKLFDAYMALPQSVHLAVGVFLFVAGIAVTARFWFVITSKYSPFVRQRSNSSKGLSPLALTAMGVAAVLVMMLPGISLLSHFGIKRSPSEWGSVLGNCGVHTLIAFAICGLLYAVWRGLIQYFAPTGKSLTKLGYFLFGTGNANTWQMLPWMIGFVFLVTVATTNIFEGSQNDEDIHAKIGFGLLVPPFILSAFVMHGIPKLFSRLWLTGVSDNRIKTAKVLLLTLMARALPATLVTIATMLAMSMSTTVGTVPVLIVSSLSVALGSISIWLIVKIHPFLSRHVGFFVLGSLLIAGVFTVAMVSNAHNLFSNVSQFVETIGPWGGVLGAVALTAGISALCVWDASRSMGTSAAMMETGDVFVVVPPQ